MGADLSRADLHNSTLQRVKINDARAWYADFRNAQMQGAYLWGSDFREADLSKADLSGADLRNTQLVMTKFAGATLHRCKVYGIAAWDIDLSGADQSDLIISAPNQSDTITVDKLEIAQFIYLLLTNRKVRDVLDTVTSKVVLILGRFTAERKRVLDRLREELRRRDLVPVLFDFEGQKNRDLTETVSTLAHMARFVIADLTDPQSVPQELQAIVPSLPSVPVQPIIHEGQAPWSLFAGLQRFPWVLEPFKYRSLDHLCECLSAGVIEPASEKARTLRQGTVPR